MEGTYRLVGMKLRSRVLAALFALFALSLSWVQGVWASTCEPGMGVESTLSVPAEAGGMEMDCPTRMGMSHSEAPTESQDQRDSPHCPFGPMAASGGCAVAPLMPVHAPVSVAPSPEGALLAVSPGPMRDLLSVFAFFRPPRA